MPRFYFHLSAPDEALPDTIGCEIDDLATAHARAVKLAERIIMLARSAESIADLLDGESCGRESKSRFNCHLPSS